ncbi:NAD kinase [Amphibacillus cookii]|uniref:NAD kinase n=1 Tax=Amphibacillus cookii TaxID=767787 RepID=UPI00195DD802|nr:NAD+ kinase [Amphibacillus cookii]
MIKHVYIHYPQTVQGTFQANEIKQQASTYPVQFVDQANQADIIISLGDDGQFLHTVRETGFSQSALYIGAAQELHFGQYATIHYADLGNLWSDILNEETYEAFDLLEVSIDNGKTHYCLNEFSMRSSIIKTIAIDVFIDQKLFEHYQGDGLIISTPTGSTAYNKSVGGALVEPTLTCMQLTKIAPLTNVNFNLLHSPTILSKKRTVRLEVIQDGNDYPIVGLDNEAYPISLIREVDVKLSERQLHYFKPPGLDYIEQISGMFINNGTL